MQQYYGIIFNPKDVSWVQKDGLYIGTDQVRARDGDGLSLTDDAGNGLFVQDGGNVGIGTSTPLATLHLRAGTTTNPPLLFGDGSLLTTPQKGALEYASDRLYMTDAQKQRVIDRTSDVVVSGKTVSNTTTETEIFRGSLGSGVLSQGLVMITDTCGSISSASSSDVVTFRYYIGGTSGYLIATIESPGSNLSNDHWDVEGKLAVRENGSSRVIAYNIKLEVEDKTNVECGTQTVDTTIDEDLVVTVQWNNDKTGNVINRGIGQMELKKLGSGSVTTIASA